MGGGGSPPEPPPADRPAPLERRRDAAVLRVARHVRDRGTRLFLPLLDTMVRALPHTLRFTEAPQGTHVRLDVRLAAPATAPPVQWSVVREATRWSLFDSFTLEPSAT